MSMNNSSGSFGGATLLTDFRYSSSGLGRLVEGWWPLLPRTIAVRMTSTTAQSSRPIRQRASLFMRPPFSSRRPLLPSRLSSRQGRSVLLKFRLDGQSVVNRNYEASASDGLRPLLRGLDARQQPVCQSTSPSDG